MPILNPSRDLPASLLNPKHAMIYIDYGFYVEIAYALFDCNNTTSDCCSESGNTTFIILFLLIVLFAWCSTHITVYCLRREASKILMLSSIGIARPELRSAVLLWDKSRFGLFELWKLSP